ncbi:AAA family ATPase [Alloyangia pacifica]|uniref:ATPase family associated with various cellular activities (AAA) n=1 Tax=Alloyangia pacifica TaxID=311180 RepID=A0A1I6PS92_9RHOB|nr:ATP-binding protein [Alloyangia pacifica]SDG34316.1 ATPase family associated with various cellular activities (AAA) [Alloyangia pacifica]SFS43084.1 ATPase family associated with various cellular activities (AAA) [Alloyangia pacifica]
MTVSRLSPLTEPAPLADPFVIAAIDWVRAVLTGSDAGATRARLEALRPGSALGHISHVFGLAPVEEDLLLFALAHRVDGEVAALCAAASGDPRQGYVTAHLLTGLIGGGQVAFAAALFGHLAPGAPLRRRALVEMRETHPLAAVSLSEAVALRLASGAAPGLPAAAEALIEPPGLARLRDRAEALAWQFVPGGGLALIGPGGSGRRALAAQIAAVTGQTAVRVDARDFDSDTALAGLARDAWLDGLLVVADADPEDAQRQRPAAEEAELSARQGAEARDWTARAARRLGGRLVLLARDGTGLPPKMRRERLPLLSGAERAQVWAGALPDWPEAERNAVARHFPLPPGDISGIAATLPPDGPPGALWRACRERGGRGLEALAARIAPRFGWDDLILPAAVQGELRAIADQMRHRATVYDSWGFGKRLSGGRGVTALFAGPSGVGKTMAAEVIAGDLGLDLFKVDLSRLVSKYIGETEKNLRRVFDAAEETGACLFLDEADACLGKRSEVKDSHDRHANIEVSYLLQRMESYSGLCLMATNLKNNLDSAFLRRLRFVIDIPFPDQGDRYRIWQGAFPAGTPTEGLDLAALARLDISGGSITVIAVNAAFMAAAEGCPVGMAHIARAARGEYRKHDRTFRVSWAGGGG